MAANSISTAEAQAPVTGGALSEEEFAAELAALEAQRARLQYSRKLDADQESAEREKARADVLDRWCKAGLEQYALPSSAEEFESLGMMVSLQLEKADPDLLRMLAPAVAMPAGTERRLGLGLGALEPQDVPHLLRAHRGDVVEQLKARHEQALWQQFEQGAASQAEAAAEQQALWAQAQAESLERFNAQQRAAYVQRLHQGLG